MKEILIRMTEKQYDSLNEMSLIELHSIIRNGTPLPKGHGDLVDVKTELTNAVLDTVDLKWIPQIARIEQVLDRYSDEWRKKVLIEADKEGAEE